MPDRFEPRLQAIDQVLFDGVADEARRSPRLRRHHNLHAEADLVQRFINVLQPGTYVRPHCHRREKAGTGFECFVVLQGAIGLLLFNSEGEMLGARRLEAAGPLRGIEVAEGTYHSLVALTPDAVMLEIKQGPYLPATDKDFLEMFPREGTGEARRQEAAWRAMLVTAATPA